MGFAPSDAYNIPSSNLNLLDETEVGPHGGKLPALAEMSALCSGPKVDPSSGQVEYFVITEETSGEKTCFLKWTMFTKTGLRPGTMMLKRSV